MTPAARAGVARVHLSDVAIAPLAMREAFLPVRSELREPAVEGDRSCVLARADGDRSSRHGVLVGEIGLND